MHEIHSLEEVRAHLASDDLHGCAVQSVDLTPVAIELQNSAVEDTLFLGCKIPSSLLANIISRGALVFPTLPNLPFDLYRPDLYSPETLFDGFRPADPCSYCDTTDARIYRHWRDTGEASARTILDSLARRLHDHAITDALEEFLASKSSGRGVIAVMGGHSVQRNEQAFLKVARISRALTERGYLMVSGGGPGAMEATHLGAWFVRRTDAELLDAMKLLSAAPSYKDLNWLSAAFEVRNRFPPPSDGSHCSLGIPTWLYGHEPPTPFATHIAKYFANSVREEGLITVATSGLIFSEGSAGTIQEVFQDAAQNHYVTTGMSSPMVFLDVNYWTREKPVFPLLSELAEGHPYKDLLAIFDGVEEVVNFITSHPAIKSTTPGWEFCKEHCSHRS